MQVIPCSKSADWRERIAKAVAHVDSGLRWEMVGSYRRGELLSHAIDMVLWHPDVHSLGAQSKELLDALVTNFKNGEYSSSRIRALS